MKIVFAITIFLTAFLYIGQFEISLSPFRISLPYWYRAVAVILLIISMCLYNLGEYSNGYKKGLQKGADITIEILKQKEESI